jgi:proteasome lid subunit RPN8/RPN11
MLNEQTIKVLADCLKRARNREICGALLVGEHGAQRFFALTNMSCEVRTFFVSLFEFDRLARYAERNAMRIRAFIHSHQSSLDLSAQDVISLQISELPWIIAVSSGTEIRYRLHEFIGNDQRIQS